MYMHMHMHMHMRTRPLFTNARDGSISPDSKLLWKPFEQSHSAELKAFAVCKRANGPSLKGQFPQITNIPGAFTARLTPP
ncbi:hypothetical protein EYF80_066675 [Liparis tanakae]|uniref:Uncharacterized protein n=1 Tax=Liparis tanakae TaxID=230148 RepID=A0A4Z2E375_9TELE|nr:hypothetical protein EYF80_066675 [Liparis tanakae]